MSVFEGQKLVGFDPILVRLPPGVGDPPPTGAGRSSGASSTSAGHEQLVTHSIQ